MKKFVTIIIGILLVFFLTEGCKKEKCYKCRANDIYAYWAKGTDTIVIVNSLSGSIVPRYLIDSGYTEVNLVAVWQPFFVTYCDMNFRYYGIRDSCFEIK